MILIKNTLKWDPGLLFLNNSKKCIKFFINIHMLTLFQIFQITPWQHTVHGLRTPNEAFFHWNPELLGLGRKIMQKNSGAFGIFLAKLSAPFLLQWVLCPDFLLFNLLFLQKKPKPLYTHPKYLYDIGIWTWAEKN